jgi:hypothetical protein
MEDVGIFCGHFVNFPVFWYFFGHLEYFPPFWYVFWQPWPKPSFKMSLKFQMKLFPDRDVGCQITISFRINEDLTTIVISQTK